MKRRIMPIVLALLLLLLAACQGGGGKSEVQESGSSTEDSQSEAQAAESDDSSAPAEEGDSPLIKVMIMEFVNAPLDVDSVGLTELQERLGIQLEFQVLSSVQEEREQALTLAITSGDLADLITTGDRLTAVESYLESGIFEELTGILPEKMPNVYKTYEEYGMLKDIAQDNGKIYALASVNGQSLLTCNTNFVNADWLEQCGLTEDDVPDTTDELLELLRTFKAAGIDGIPMTGGQWMGNGYTSVDGPIIRAFGADYKWQVFDGVYSFGPYYKSEEYKNALTFLHTLYAEGLLDPEYVTHTDDDIGALIAENKVGYTFGWVDNNIDPGGNLEQYVRGGVLNRDTVGKSEQSAPANWVRWVISSSSGVKEDVYRMLDYLLSDEGKLLTSWGIEGVTFEVIDGEKQYTDLVMDGDLPPLNQRRSLGIQPHHFFHLWDLESAKSLLPSGTVESMVADAEYAYPAPPMLAPTEDETMELNQIMTDVEKYVKQTQADFVNGTKPLDEFDDFLSQLKTMGIERAIEIKQAQYERYLAR